MVNEEMKKKSQKRTMNPTNIYTVTKASLFDKPEVKEACKEIERKEKKYKKKNKEIEIYLKTEYKKEKNKCVEMLVVNGLGHEISCYFFFNSIDVLNEKKITENELLERRIFIYSFLFETMRSIIQRSELYDDFSFCDEKNKQISSKFLEFQNDPVDHFLFLDDIRVLWDQEPFFQRVLNEKIDSFQSTLFEYFVSNISRYKQKNFEFNK